MKYQQNKIKYCTVKHEFVRKAGKYTGARGYSLARGVCCFTQLAGETMIIAEYGILYCIAKLHSIICFGAGFVLCCMEL